MESVSTGNLSLITFRVSGPSNTTPPKEPFPGRSNSLASRFEGTPSPHHFVHGTSDPKGPRLGSREGLVSGVLSAEPQTNKTNKKLVYKTVTRVTEDNGTVGTVPDSVALFLWF